ncbi:MAG: DMT family transporter [Mangrovicoccus sp.]
MTLSRPMIGHLAMLGFSVLISFSFTFGGMIAGEIDPGVLTLLRFTIASTVLACVAMLNRVSLMGVMRRAWAWLLIGGLFAAYFITMFEALSLTTPLATSALFTLTPLIAAGFGFVLLGLRPGSAMLAATLLGGFGALWVIFRADLQQLLALRLGPGEKLFLMGVMAHAAVPALTRRLAPGASSLEAALGTSLGSLVVTAAYAMPQTLLTDFSLLRPMVWFVALYLGVVTTAITFFLLQTAIARISPGKVMAYTYLLPSLVLVQGLVLHGRSEPAQIYWGVGVTLIALALLVFQDRQKA